MEKKIHIYQNVIEKKTCKDLVNQILFTMKHVNTTTESTKWMMKYGSVFAKNKYGNSKRRIFFGKDVEDHFPLIKSMYVYEIGIFLSQEYQTMLYALPLDQYPLALEILVYDKPGDFITWHVDSCYVKKDQRVLTALLCLENNSKQQLCIETYEPNEQDVQCMDIQPGSMYVFDHYHTYHKIIPRLEKDESRIMIAMVFAQYPYSASIGEYMSEKFKTIAHYSNWKALQILTPIDKFVLICIFIIILLLCFHLYQTFFKSKKIPS